METIWYCDKCKKATTSTDKESKCSCGELMGNAGWVSDH